MTNFIDNTISDRLRIVESDANPVHVYEVMSKHYGESIDLLKKRFDVRLDIVKRRVFFLSKDSGQISELVNYLSGYGVEFESVSFNSVRIDLDGFFRNIY